MSALTDEPKVISLIQEYEPIFHGFSATRAVCVSGFDVPSYPIFNSTALVSFFRNHKLGIFKRDANAIEGKEFAVFNHIINRLPRQPLKEMQTRRDRLCVVYARPEAHAERNLYEFVELSLKRLCRAGRFGPHWRFVGLGCLSQLTPVDLGSGHWLEFIEKMPEDDYQNFAASIDLGISFMYAPHPSVVPFELATTGAVVVTNTFENRSKDYFAEISANIIAVEPTLHEVVAGIEQALDRVENFQTRWKNAYSPPPKDWSSTFDEKFIESTIGNVLA